MRKLLQIKTCLYQQLKVRYKITMFEMFAGKKSHFTIIICSALMFPKLLM